MYRCKNCDFAFTAPLPPAEEFEVFYEEDYTDSEDWRTCNRLSVNEYWSHLRPFFPDKPFRFLEVGGAFGHFSAKVKSDTEASVVMLECGKSAANHARDELGLEVVQSFYENYHPVKKFDIIFSAHVIEHVRDVRAYFEHSAKMLNPGGSIILITPNGGAWKFRFFGASWCWASTEHLHFLSPKSARLLAGQTGFTDCISRALRPSHWRYPGFLIGFVSRWKNLWKYRAITQPDQPVTAAPAASDKTRSKVGRVFYWLNRWAGVEQRILTPVDAVLGSDELLVCATLPTAGL